MLAQGGLKLFIVIAADSEEDAAVAACYARAAVCAHNKAAFDSMRDTSTLEQMVHELQWISAKTPMLRPPPILGVRTTID